MTKNILHHVIADGWKWLTVIVVSAALATAGKSWISAQAKDETAHDSFGVEDCVFEMETIDQAVQQLGAGEIDNARRTLVTRLHSLAAQVTAQTPEDDLAARHFAILGLMRQAQSQQANPELYSTSSPGMIYDIENRPGLKSQSAPKSSDLPIFHPTKEAENN